MKKWVILTVSILSLLIICVPLFAEGDDISNGRTLGLGMEVGFPWGGLVSARYWFNSQLGVEGIIFAWGDLADITGTFTGRVLYKLSGTETVGFYIVTGATIPFSPYGENELVFSSAGGIEFNLPFAPNLALNLEFGGALSTTGTFMMALGTGIHFYF